MRLSRDVYSPLHILGRTTLLTEEARRLTIEVLLPIINHASSESLNGDLEIKNQANVPHYMQLLLECHFIVHC